MSYTEGADGSLTIGDDASSPAADLQKIADLAMKMAGGLKLTEAEREQLTASQTRVGWLLSATDTGRVYLRTAADPMGVLIAGVDLPHFGYQRVDPYNFDPGTPAAITYAENPFEGKLSGFTTSNRRVFTCDLPGVYLVAAVAAAVSGSGTPETYTNLQIQRNGSTLAAGNSQSIARANWFTSPTATASATIRFQRGDTLQVAIGSGLTVAGATGPNCAMFVDYLHP
jgi:hypothetical protein